MRKIVLDIQSGIHARNMERMLMQKFEDCQIVLSESPDETADWCRTHNPDVLLMRSRHIPRGCSAREWRSARG